MKYLKINGSLSLMFLACMMLSVFSCTNDDKFQLTDETEVDFTTFGVDFNKEGQIPYIYNINPSFFDFSNKDEAKINYDLIVQGDPSPSMEVFISYSGSSGDLGPFSIGNFDVPAESLELTFVEAANLVGLEIEDVATLDEFILTGTTSSGTPSTPQIVIAGCPSFLGGTYDFVSTDLVAENSPTDCPTDPVTGTVTFEDQGGGVYIISDLGFGQYESTCWNDGPATSGAATITDQCGKITSGGADQYGLVYDWVITDVTGPNLSISWTNNYADSGKTVVTRPDGTDWPPIYTE